jgi:glycosyltransferase involved in cell wall biosynthesis
MANLAHDGAGSDAAARPAVSVVVPFYNERPVVEELYRRIHRVMDRRGQPYEMIFVNDGSSDGTAEVLEQIALKDRRVCFIDLRRNFGQTTALQAGFDQAAGGVILALDGDLQHDPYEIPLLLEKIEEGYDIASGWRRRRGDGLFSRRLPSRIANRLLAKVSRVDLNDFGTTFKAYRAEVLKDVRLYGDMHRFVPAVCARLGARICEVPIKNVRRKAGKSNYGIGRTFRVAMDLLMLQFISGYLTRPLHFFGKAAMLCMVTGGGILGYGFVRKIVALCSGASFNLFTTHGPLMAVGLMAMMAGLLFISTGLIGELLMRVYFEATAARTYAVRRIVRKAEGPVAENGGHKEHEDHKEHKEEKEEKV